MKISMINGSPKLSKSCSSLLLEELKKSINEKSVSSFDITNFDISKHALNEIELNEVTNSDILVVAFPLYVDGRPSHVLEELYELESAFSGNPNSRNTVLYGIVNNGFSESHQNKNAAKMLELFCKRSGIIFGQVLALGGGEVIRQMLESGMPFLTAKLSYIKDDWNTFVDNIVVKRTGSTLFCSFKFPTWLFRIVGNSTFWNKSAKENGISKKQMKRRIISQ